ncbi:hypothetical protein WJX81_001648 [Elliptochloris bilobata]|uniref:ResB-like domain-containing protein n=1 Tax=Elliptochloris bilobata TaxID=381761 RepID=A0AAW1QVD6_9CHLO
MSSLARVTLTVSGVLPAPVDCVWPLVRDFGNIAKWLRRVGSQRVDSELLPGQIASQVGSVRRVLFDLNYTVVEQLEALDDELYILKYKLISHPWNSSPFAGAFLNFVSTIQLKDVTMTNATYFEWHGEFDTDHQSADVMRSDIKRRFEAGFHGLAAAVAESSGAARGLLAPPPAERARVAAAASGNLASAPELSERGGGPPGGGPGGSPGEGPSLPKVLWNRTLRQLSSLPLAICELAVIAVLSSLGTIIEQGKPLEFYMQNYPDGARKVAGFVDWRLIQAAQLDHIYTAGYFLGLLGLLGASLAACTATRQWPAVRVARRWRFAQTPERVYSFGGMQNAVVLPNAEVRGLGRVLQQRGFQVFVRDGALYAFRGLGGKLGPIGVHAAMLAIMAGVAYGGLCGLKGSVMVPEGGDFLLSQVLTPKSALARLPSDSDAMLRVNAFDVKYREDGAVDQFLSDISVLGPRGDELLRKSISVNDPLRFRGVTAYQVDYSMAALTVHAAGSPLQPPDGSPFNLPMASLEGRPGIKGKLWATFVPAEAPAPGRPPRGASVVARDFQTVALYGSDGAFVGVRRPGSGKPIEVDGMSVVVDAIVGSTGLELKSDPGVPFVYAGFAGLMVTTLVSYLSHAQVWALQEGSALHASGRSNRAKIGFADEVEAAYQALPLSLPETEL